MQVRELLLITSIGLVLAGCTSNQYYDYTPQYCYTDQAIVKQDGTNVSSATVVQCTDRPGQQMQIARAGIDSKCEEFFYPERRWNTTVEVRGVRCEKLDGSWEVLNINGTVN
jgi:hypothetical protein